ncbi:MAG: hypothetical protein V4727_10855 [Verrucomicrobiota bacterium]
MKDPKQLIKDYLNDTLDDSGQAELSIWLKEDAAHMLQFTQAAMFDQEIRAAVHAKVAADTVDRFTGSGSSIHLTNSSSTLPFKPTPITSHRLARAAAWLGAFAWFGNKAQAAGTAMTATQPAAILTQTTATIVMTKTATTAITAAILIAGGGSVFLIHRSNQQTAERISDLQTRGLQKNEATPFQDTAPALPRTVESSVVPTNLTVREQLLDWRKLFDGEMDSGSPEYNAKYQSYLNNIGNLDVSEYKEMLLEAEQMGDLPLGLLQHLLEHLAAHSLADVVTYGAPFAASHSSIKSDVGNAFRSWLDTDPAAANAWYLKAVESGELLPKGIPPKGEGAFTPDRYFARVRFTALLQSDPAGAEAVMASMSARDVMLAVRGLDNPELVGRITKLLPPSQKVNAVAPHFFNMAQTDANAALEWAESLGIGEAERAALMRSNGPNSLNTFPMDLHD